MHALQGPLFGHLRPASQRTGVISFTSNVVTFGTHPKSRGELIYIICGHPRPAPRTPMRKGNLIRTLQVATCGPHNKKQGCCHLLPMLPAWAPRVPQSFHSYRSDCRTVGTDPPNRGYIPHWDVTQVAAQMLCRLRTRPEGRTILTAHPAGTLTCPLGAEDRSARYTQSYQY